MPVTVIAGPDQTREPRSPVPTSGSPGTTSASVRNSSSEEPSPVHGSRRRPSTATSPFSSWSVASACTRTPTASGAAPPYWPLCFGPASVSTSIVVERHPPEADRERRDARPDAAHVRDQHRVGPEQLRVGRGVVEERAAADLLLTLDHELDPDRRPAVPDAERADVGDDVRLRVGGAAAEERAVPFGELVRRRLPLPSSGRPERRRSGRREAPSEHPRGRGSRRR